MSVPFTVTPNGALQRLAHTTTTKGHCGESAASSLLDSAVCVECLYPQLSFI
jgi:hypothetical protein